MAPLAARRVFFINEQMVIGPTPPGTGVIYEHRGATLSKSTSPLSRNPLFLVASGTLVVPTSIIVAPSLTISLVTNPGCPRAAIIMSASRQISFISFVALWHTVTVASPGMCFCIIRTATGFPTILLRPSTTQRFPFVGISYLARSSMIPAGVADM